MTEALKQRMWDCWTKKYFSIKWQHKYQNNSSGLRRVAVLIVVYGLKYHDLREEKRLLIDRGIQEAI